MSSYVLIVNQHWPECLVSDYRQKLFNYAHSGLTARFVYCTGCGHRDRFRLCPYFLLRLCYVTFVTVALKDSEIRQGIILLVPQRGLMAGHNTNYVQ